MCIPLSFLGVLFIVCLIILIVKTCFKTIINLNKYETEGDMEQLYSKENSSQQKTTTQSKNLIEKRVKRKLDELNDATKEFYEEYDEYKKKNSEEF